MKYNEIIKRLNENGLLLLTSENDFENITDKHTLQCKNGHVWNTRLSDILHRGLKRESKGCPHCAKAIYENISEEAMLKNLIKGHTIVSYEIKQVKNDGTKERFYKVKCDKNHFYEKRTPLLSEGCPSCSIGVFVGEERVRIIFEKIFSTKFTKTKPDWLINKNTGRKLELDGYNDELKIAFEYNGRQHFDENTHFSNDYKEQIERDLIKVDLCNKNNIKLYTINQCTSYAHDKFLSNVTAQLIEQGLDKNLTKNLTVDFNILNTESSLLIKYDNFKTLVNENNLELISTSLSTMNDELEFECEKNHRFTMTGLKFKEILNKTKSRDYFCAECHQEKTGVTKNSSIKIEDIQNFAKSINYTLLSTTYVNVSEPMEWMCNNGHKFEKSYRSFQRSKTQDYCVECAKNKPIKKVSSHFKTNDGGIITINDVDSFAKTIGFTLVSTEYINVTTPLTWICNNGHKIEKDFRAFKRNSTGIYCNCCKEEGFVKFSNTKKEKLKTGEIIDMEFLEKFAQERNVEILSAEYENVNTLMSWKCGNGHLFTKTLRQMQRNLTGKYCKECKK